MDSFKSFLILGNISWKLLQLVTMQHASFLYRQRALRGLRATITSSTSGYTISSFKVSTIISPFALVQHIPHHVFLYSSRLLGTPTPRTLYFLVEAKSRVREVYAQTCHHFSKQGMLDTELFGLAVYIGKQRQIEAKHFYYTYTKWSRYLHSADGMSIIHTRISSLLLWIKSIGEVRRLHADCLKSIVFSNHKFHSLK